MQKVMYEGHPRVRFPLFVYSSLFLGTMFVVTLSMVQSSGKSRMDHEYRMKELDLCSISKPSQIDYEAKSKDIENALSASKKGRFW